MKSAACRIAFTCLVLAAAGHAEAGSLTFQAIATSGSLDGVDLTGQEVWGSVSYQMLKVEGEVGPDFIGYGAVTLSLTVEGKTFTLSDPQTAWVNEELWFPRPYPFDDAFGAVRLDFSDQSGGGHADFEVMSPYDPPPGVDPGGWVSNPIPYASGDGSASLGPNGRDGSVAFDLGTYPEPSTLASCAAGGLAIAVAALLRRCRRQMQPALGA